MTINYQKQFKELADRLALRADRRAGARARASCGTCGRSTRTSGKVARANRERTIEQVLAIFRGRGVAGDTTGNSPAASGSRSTRSPSTSTTAGATRAGPTRCSAPSRTRRSSSARSSCYARPDKRQPPSSASGQRGIGSPLALSRKRARLHPHPAGGPVKRRLPPCSRPGHVAAPGGRTRTEAACIFFGSDVDPARQVGRIHAEQCSHNPRF